MRENVGNVATFRIDELGLPGELGSIESGYEPQRRTLERRRALDPRMDFCNARPDVVAATRRADEIALSQEPHADITSAFVELAELRDTPLAHMVKIQREHGRTERCCPLEDPLRGDRAGR